MTRLFPTIAILALLAAPIAAAAAPDAPLAEAAPRVDLAKVRAAADKVGDSVADAGRGVASAASAIGHGLASVAGAIASGLASAARAIGAALVAVVGALGRALAAIGHLLAALGLAGARAVAAHPKESAIVAGSATGLGALAYLAKRFWLAAFLPLYSRLAPSEMLDNRMRAAVYDHVKQNPGAHPSAIAEALQLGWGTVVYHLARLEDSSLVTSRSAHNRKCFFAVGADLDNAGRTAVAAMSTDKARAIVDAVRAEPGLSQKDLAARLAMSQALASWHVKRLVASGVLVAERVGRSNCLRVAEHVPVVARSVPVVAA